MLWIAKLLLLFPFERKNDILEMRCACLQYQECKRPSEGIDNKNGCARFSWSTKDKMDYGMRVDDSMGLHVGE